MFGVSWSNLTSTFFQMGWFNHHLDTLSPIIMVQWKIGPLNDSGNFHLGDTSIFLPKNHDLGGSFYFHHIFSLGFQDSSWRLQVGWPSSWYTNPIRIPWFFEVNFGDADLFIMRLDSQVGFQPGWFGWLGERTFGGRNVGWCDHQMLNLEKNNPKAKTLPLKSGGNGRSCAGVKMA